MAPTTISISATDIATRMEISDASSASPIHNAECSQTLAMTGPRSGAGIARPTTNAHRAELRR